MLSHGSAREPGILRGPRLLLRADGVCSLGKADTDTLRQATAAIAVAPVR